MSLPEELTPEEEYLLAKLRTILENFDNPPTAAVLRQALIRLRTQRPEEVVAALPELRQEALALLETLLRNPG